MNYDEFAFFNQQLAGMLRSGIPLEGAIKQLSRSMRKSGLRSELELLEKDLREGIPLSEAVQRRKLPVVYTQIIRAGAQSESLPAVLTLLADYYTKLHSISTRLKGIMVYPIIILACSFALSVFLSITYTLLIRQITNVFVTAPMLGPGGNYPSAIVFWMTPFILFLVLGVFVTALMHPRLRHWLRWHVPGMKEASLAQSASTMAAMLSSGAQLDTSLGLIEQVEAKTPAGKDIALWRQFLREGHSRFADMAVRSRVFPPLFVWLVAQGGENLANGFQRAADIYGDRANNKADMLLYAALPLAVVLVGLLIMGQVLSVMGVVVRFLNLMI